MVDEGIDAFRPDAGIQQVLQQTTNTVNADQNSIFCTGDGDISWYRVFAPSEHGVTGGFTITEVTFGIQETLAQSPPITVRIGTYGGAVGTPTLDLAQVQPIAQATAAAPVNLMSPGINITTPISGVIPQGKNLIVEIAAPNMPRGGNALTIGASNAGEMHPGYYRSVPCSTLNPTRPQDLGAQFATCNINITVSGIR